MSNIDEALAYVARTAHATERVADSSEGGDNYALRLLAAEVDRLRQVEADKNSRIHGMLHAEANAKSHYERVEAENAELRAKVNELSDISTEHARAFQEKRKEAEALKAKLAWFEEYATIVSVITARYIGFGTAPDAGIASITDAVSELVEWEAEHPKPE